MGYAWSAPADGGRFAWDLKAGGAYVPLDPAYPQDRLTQMIEDSAPAVLVTLAEFAERLSASKVQKVRLDADWPEIARQLRTPPVSNARPDNLAYVLYTSGSTGRPKGVMILHGHVLNYIWALAAGVRLDDVSKYIMVQPLSVDSSVTVLYAALLFGGELHVIGYEESLDAERLASYTRLHAIDCLKIAPPHLQALMEIPESARLLPHKLLIVGGDVSHWDWINRQVGCSQLPDLQSLWSHGDYGGRYYPLR